MKSVARVGAVVMTGCLVLVSPAFADDVLIPTTPQSQYTLDGAPVTQDAVAGAICTQADPAGVVAECFSSDKEFARVGLEALRRGANPPGYSVVPDGFRERLTAMLSSQARDGIGRPPAASGPPRLTAGAARATSKRSRSRLKARAADGYVCGLAYTYVYEHVNLNAYTAGNYHAYGATGSGNWLNFPGSMDNRTSSFWAAEGRTSRWHDYAYGQGAYYGNGYACRYVENVGNGSMTDGGTANDRFSSFGYW